MSNSVFSDVSSTSIKKTYRNEKVVDNVCNTTWFVFVLHAVLVLFVVRVPLLIKHVRCSRFDTCGKLLLYISVKIK